MLSAFFDVAIKSFGGKTRSGNGIMVVLSWSNEGTVCKQALFVGVQICAIRHKRRTFIFWDPSTVYPHLLDNEVCFYHPTMLSLRQLLQTSNFIMKEVVRNKIAVVWPPLPFRCETNATLPRCFFIWKTEGHEGPFLGGWSNKPLVGDWLSGLLWKMKLEGYKCLIWGVPWQITSYSWREVTIATAFMKWKLRKEGLSWDLHLDWLCCSCAVMSSFVVITLLLNCPFTCCVLLLFVVFLEHMRIIKNGPHLRERNMHQMQKRQ